MLEVSEHFIGVAVVGWLSHPGGGYLFGTTWGDYAHDIIATKTRFVLDKTGQTMLVIMGKYLAKGNGMCRCGNVRRYCGAFTAVVVCVMWIGGCSELPSNPSPKVSGEYVVYFCNTTGNRMLYSYNPYSQVMDSVALNYQLTGYEYFRGVTVSPDGSLLYMPIQSRSLVVVFDIGSLNVVTELPYKTGSPVAISPDGSRMAIFGKDLWILDTDDYSVVFHDTADIYKGVFSANSQRLYAVALGFMPPEAQMLYVLDMSGAEASAETRILSAGPLHSVVPTQDESKLLLYAYFGRFVIYDPARDSILFEHFMLGGPGQIVLDADERSAFYGSPGTVLPPDPGSSAFAVIDVTANGLDEVIDTRFVIDAQTPEWFEVGSMVVTPDGRYLVMLDAPWANELLLFDIENRTFVDYIDFGRDVELTNIDLRTVNQ